jgi:hypothetical protein
MKDSTRNLVSAIIKGDKYESAAAFESVIRNKINAALDAQKKTIADSVFNKAK